MDEYKAIGPRLDQLRYENTMPWFGLTLIKDSFATHEKPTTPILVNGHAITYIQPKSDDATEGCIVYFDSGVSIKVKETLEAIPINRLSPIF